MSEKNGFFRRVRDRIVGLFPEHQVIFRTDGNVRFFKLSTGMQLGVAAIGMVGVLWLTATTYEYVAQNKRLAANRTEMNQMAGQVDVLNDNMRQLEQRILERAAVIDKRQDLLRNVLENGFLGEGKIDLEPLMEDAVAEDDAQQDAKAHMRPRSGQEPSAYYGSIFDHLESTQVAFAESMRAYALARRSKVHDLLEDLKIDPASFEDGMGPSSAEQELVAGLGPDAGAVGGPLVELDSAEATSEEGAGSSEQSPGLFTMSEELAISGENADVFAELKETWESVRTLDSQLTSIPAIAPLKKYFLSSKFGRRRDPFTKRWARHEGVDLAAWYGSAVLASTEGTVTNAGYKAGYGRMVLVDHGNGFETLYGHLRRISVKKGDKVELGQKLGETGSTGRSTGPHVHYEIHFNGQKLNPAPFIKASENVLEIQGRNARG